jgi:hypothetical protein
MTLGEVIADLFDMTLIDNDVYGAWKKTVVGLTHLRAVAFDPTSGTLTVEADSKAWATQARLLAPTLIKRLNTILGKEKIAHVRLVLGTTPSIGSLSSAATNPPPPPIGALDLIRPLRTDPDLGEAAERQTRHAPREPREAFLQAQVPHQRPPFSPTAGLRVHALLRAQRRGRS